MLKVTTVFYTAAMDVSADLRELGRTPVTVVCAGVKSILDIGRTLQYLVSVSVQFNVSFVLRINSLAE